MDRVRQVLLAIEGSEEPWQRFDDEDGKYIAILKDGGFVEATLLTLNLHGIAGAVVERLTWQGHDLIDAIRDESVWESTKERVLKPGASWTLSVLLEVAKQEKSRTWNQPSGTSELFFSSHRRC